MCQKCIQHQLVNVFRFRKLLKGSFLWFIQYLSVFVKGVAPDSLS